MSDVFVSYASEDREQAESLAKVLATTGWSVWWDRKIVAGQPYDRAIERELETAGSVVVLWSRYSVASEWVNNEATVGLQRGVLVPVMIDRVKPPLEFRRRQAAELLDWHGEASHRGLQTLCEGVTAALGSAPRRPATTLGAARRRWPSGRRLAAILATMVTIAVIAAVVGAGLDAPAPRADQPGATVGQHAGRQSGASSAGEKPRATDLELADLVAGSYFGEVTADSKGSSRSDVGVRVAKIDRSTVRVSSDHARLATIDVRLTRVENQIVNADGDTPFMVNLDRDPPLLTFNPHNELAYTGSRRK